MLREIEEVIQTVGAEGDIPKMENAIHELESVLAGLNTLRVSGKDNLDRLLGAIILLEKIIGEEK